LKIVLYCFRTNAKNLQFKQWSILANDTISATVINTGLQITFTQYAITFFKIYFLLFPKTSSLNLSN